VFVVCRSAREAREVQQTAERKLRVVAWLLEV